MPTFQTRGRALVVDDEELISRELSSLLSDLGYNACATAASASDALRLVAELAPSLITMDINLGPPGQGFAVVTLIRTTDLTTPVLFVTGGAEPDAGEAIRALGRSGYVPKPFTRADIAIALTTLLNENGGAEDNDV